MATINQLSAVDSLQGGDQIPIYDSSNGDARKSSLTLLTSYIVDALGSDINYFNQYASPAASGFNVLLEQTGQSIWLVINPTTSFTDGQITLPNVSNLTDDQEIIVVCTQEVINFTVSGGGATVVGAPDYLPAYSAFSMRYNLNLGTWYVMNNTGSGATGATSITRDDFTGDGVTTAFTLGAEPGALGEALIVTIDGLYQEAANYSVSGTTLTFTTAPPLGSAIETMSFVVSAFGTTTANLVSYAPAGLGAVTRTVESKLRETVSVKDFGAVGDGVTDDSSAIQAAIDSLTEGQTLFFNIPKAYLGTGISRTDIPSRVTIDFNGCHVTAHSSVAGMFIFTGVNTDRGNRTLAAPNYTSPISPPSATVYVRGVRKFELTDASGIQTGDWVQFSSSRKFDIAGTKTTFEVNRVWEVDGNTVYVDGESLVAFEQGDTLNVRALSEGFTIKNGYIDQQGVNESGILVAGFNRPKIQNMMFVDPFRYGLYVQYCCEDQVVNCNVRHSGTPTSPVAGYSGEYGYGFIHSRNCFSRVDNCVGSDGWHSFEAADGQRDITYTSCIAIADGHGFSTHQNCVSAIYINCQAKARLPMTMRCRYPKILGGDYTKTTADATFSFSNAWEAVVKGISYKCDREVNSEGNFYNQGMANNSDYTDEPQDFISRMIFQDNFINCKAGRFYLGFGGANNECYAQNNILNIIEGTIYLNAINKVVAKNNSFNYIQENSDDGVSPGGFSPFVYIGTSGTANTDAVLFDGNLVSVLSSGASGADLLNYSCAGSAKITVTNNTFYAMSGVRYAIRAYSAGNDLHMYGNIFTSPNSAVNSFSRIINGTVNINAINNIYPNYITYNTAYNIGYGGTVIEATNEIFLGKKTTLFSNMPTSTTGLPAGSLWNNAGVVNIV